MPERKAAARNRGVRTGVVSSVLVSLGLIVAAVAGAVHILVAKWETPMAGPNAPMDVPIAGPQLQSAPQYDRSRYDAEKEALLNRYEWIDRKNNVARIPVEVAIRVVSSQGVTPGAAAPVTAAGAGR